MRTSQFDVEEPNEGDELASRHYVMLTSRSFKSKSPAVRSVGRLPARHSQRFHELTRPANVPGVLPALSASACKCHAMRSARRRAVLNVQHY